MPSSFLAKIKQAEQTEPLLNKAPINSSYVPPVVVAQPLPVVAQPLPVVAQPLPVVAQPPALQNSNLIYNKLVYAIQNNKLQRFYPHERVVQLAQQISSVSLQGLANDFKMNSEVAIDLFQLALYDIVILADDSGSMAMTDGRIEELKVVAEKIARVATKFDGDGITLCFLNDKSVYTNQNESSVNDLIKRTRYSGSTPIGSVLRNRIIDPIVVKADQPLQKPVLVIILTDGEPDNKDDVYNALKYAKDYNERVGSNCVEFEFAQIGNDKLAQKFLYDLDVHPIVGDIVDVTSSYELEEEEFAKAGANLTPYMWILKLMLGTIDPQYDAGDEKNN